MSRITQQNLNTVGVITYILIAIAVGYYSPAWPGLTGKIFAGLAWPALLVLKPIGLLIGRPVMAGTASGASWVPSFAVKAKPLVGDTYFLRAAVLALAGIMAVIMSKAANWINDYIPTVEG